MHEPLPSLSKSHSIPLRKINRWQITLYPDKIFLHPSLAHSLPYPSGIPVGQRASNEGHRRQLGMHEGINGSLWESHWNDERTNTQTSAIVSSAHSWLICSPFLPSTNIDQRVLSDRETLPVKIWHNKRFPVRPYGQLYTKGSKSMVNVGSEVI